MENDRQIPQGRELVMPKNTRKSGEECSGFVISPKLNFFLLVVVIVVQIVFVVCWFNSLWSPELNIDSSFKNMLKAECEKKDLSLAKCFEQLLEDNVKITELEAKVKNIILNGKENTSLKLKNLSQTAEKVINEFEDFRKKVSEILWQNNNESVISVLQKNVTSIAKNAELKADETRRMSEQAKTTANEAKTTAGEAKRTADETKTTADEATTTADEAKTKANEAKTTADEAITTADEAKTTANEAKTTANEAKTTADQAKTTADQAKTTADIAQTLADEANATATSNKNELILQNKTFSVRHAEFSAYIQKMDTKQETNQYKMSLSEELIDQLRRKETLYDVGFYMSLLCLLCSVMMAVIVLKKGDNQNNSFSPRTAPGSAAPRAQKKEKIVVYDLKWTRPMENSVCVVVFHAETETRHIQETRSVFESFGETVPKIQSRVVRQHADIVDLPGSKVHLVFVDFNERNIILEDPAKGLGDLRVTTVRSLWKFGADVTVIYCKDKGSRNLGSELFNRELTSIFSHPELSELKNQERMLSIFHGFTQEQKKHCKEFINRQLKRA